MMSPEKRYKAGYYNASQLTRLINKNHDRFIYLYRKGVVERPQALVEGKYYYTEEQVSRVKKQLRDYEACVKKLRSLEQRYSDIAA